MQITKMTLTQFLDNFQAKICNKHHVRVKIKVEIFMDVFEVGDLPLRMVTSLYGWKTSLLGGEFSLGGVTPP